MGRSFNSLIPLVQGSSRKQRGVSVGLLWLGIALIISAGMVGEHRQLHPALSSRAGVPFFLPLISLISFNCSGGQSIQTSLFPAAVHFLMQLHSLGNHNFLFV